MIFTSNMHTHTTFCDGKNTPEEMAEAAIAAGLRDLGFSAHSPALFDPEYSLRDPAAYYTALKQVKKKYEGRLRIYMGEEADCFAQPSRKNCDFLIGSVHYFKDGQTGAYYALDAEPETLKHALNLIFHGDAQAMVETFYQMSAEFADSLRPDIIGHFDLIVKLNASGSFFDESSAWYRKTALEAITAAAESGAVFEVNTGGVYRGCRRAPYPSDFLLKRLLELHAPVTLSSDCHDARSLTFQFEETAERLRTLGFRSFVAYENGAFQEKELK